MLPDQARSGRGFGRGRVFERAPGAVRAQALPIAQGLRQALQHGWRDALGEAPAGLVGRLRIGLGATVGLAAKRAELFVHISGTLGASRPHGSCGSCRS